MAHEPSPEAKTHEVPRRRFLRDTAIAATVTCLSPGLSLGCQATRRSTVSTDADLMDQALEMMAKLAPLTNHGPMASEALVALGRGDSVVAFVEAYRKRFTSPYPDTRQPVTRENWREALGDDSRVADWTGFFNRELKEAAWPQVLEQWSSVLAPGFASAAAHGVIRTGHAVRSLSVKETESRRRELAEGLGYWAAYYQTLPEGPDTEAKRLRPAEAINQVPVLPVEKRPRNGSIMIGLRSINGFPPFAPVANLVETTGKADQLLSEITETFATAYVKNVTARNFVTLLHTVTSTTSLRSLLPYLSPATTRRMLRYGWQMSAALYSISAIGSTISLREGSEPKRADLIERAVALQEEHAIKFTEACLRNYGLNPKPVYLLAANDALERLQSSRL